MDPKKIFELSRTLVATLGGLFFVYVGIMHFVDTDWFNPIVPPWLGWPTFWVILSGIFEIGIGSISYTFQHPSFLEREPVKIHRTEFEAGIWYPKKVADDLKFKRSNSDKIVPGYFHCPWIYRKF